jgi:DNA polymerase III delta subunit
MPVEQALVFLRGVQRNHTPSAAIVIAGPQPFLREYVLERLRAEFVGQGFSYRSFQAGGADRIDAVIAELDGADLFAPKRFVVCRLLRTFRDRGGANDDGADHPSGAPEGRGETDLAAAFERLSPTVRLAIVCERETAPAKLRRAAEQLGVLITCGRPFDNQLAQYADQFAWDAGLKLAASASELLIARHGSDLGAIANAIARAAITAAPDQALDAAAFDESGAVRIPDLFELAEAVARGNPVEGLALMGRAIQTGRDPIEMLAVEIIPQLRRMLVAAALLAQRGGAPAVARSLGLPPQSAMVTRACDGARRFGVARLTAAHRRACELDERFKMGLLKERAAALDGLLLDLMTVTFD